jgi:hypothetical protein
MTDYVASSPEQITDPQELIAALSKVITVALTSDVLDPNSKMYMWDSGYW